MNWSFDLRIIRIWISTYQFILEDFFARWKSLSAFIYVNLFWPSSTRCETLASITIFPFFLDQTADSSSASK